MKGSYEYRRPDPSLDIVDETFGISVHAYGAISSALGAHGCLVMTRQHAAARSGFRV